jgi:class I lanthipeptide synthase
MRASDSAGVSGTASRRRAGHGFEPAGFFLVRSPLLTVDAYRGILAAGPAAGDVPLAGGDHGAQEAMGRLLRDPLVASAIASASPDLFRELSATRAASSPRGGKAFSGLFRYLNRMSTRPTPYGLFAGVGFGWFAQSTSLRLAADPLGAVSCCPDMGWLDAVARAAEDLADADPGLVVLASQAVLEQGQRLSVFRRSSAQGDDPIDDVASIKASPPVRSALALATEPIALGELTGLMRERHPSAGDGQISRLLRQLLEAGFLVSGLLPSGASSDRCGHVADRIPAGGSAGHIAVRLREVADKLRYLEKTGHGDMSPADLLDVEDSQRALAPGYTGATMQIDSALNLTGRELTWKVGHAVADAVTAIAAAAPDPAHPQLAVYAAEFTKRYGAGAEIPVLEVLDPHWGLDAPPTYLAPPRRFPLAERGPEIPPAGRDREYLLMSWIAEAIAENKPVVLSDERVGQLSHGLAAPRPCPLVDAYVQVHAASRAALDSGDWLAVIGPMGVVPSARTFGRFGHLLGPVAGQTLKDHVSREQGFDPGPVYAELSYRPPRANMGNLNSNPGWREYEIPVNVPPSVQREKVLALSDLLIGVQEGAFYTRSRRLGREVIVRQSHMLSPLKAPNVCRFLLEISAARDGAVPRFQDYPILDRLPFCPRVVRGRVVLLPACWNLTQDTLRTPEPGASAPFAGRVRSWRDRMRVPRHVYLWRHDQRLLLDLDHPTCLAQLERAIGRLAPDPRSPLHYQKLQECLPGLDGAWLDDEQGRPYFSEFVIPLKLTAKTAPRHPVIPAAQPNPAVSPAVLRQVPPGGRWAYLRLAAAPDRHDQIIESFCRFASELEAHGSADAWFFMRYADPHPHVRARVRSCTPDGQAILAALTQWAGCQVAGHLVREFSADTYHPEVDRYGGEQGIGLAEQIFCGDSAGAGAVISWLRTGSPACDPVLAASFTLDCLLSSLRLDDGDKLRLGCLRSSPFTSTVQYRERRTRLIAMLRSARGERTDHDAEIIGDLYADGAAKRQAAATAAAALWERGELGHPWPSVIDSLAHMHINRMLGIDRAAEREVYALLGGALRSVLSFSSRVAR